MSLDNFLLDKGVMDKAFVQRGNFEEEEERSEEKVRVEAKAKAASIRAISSSLIISMGI